MIYRISSREGHCAGWHLRRSKEGISMRAPGVGLPEVKKEFNRRGRREHGEKRKIEVFLLFLLCVLCGLKSSRHCCGDNLLGCTSRK
jgi:hypothetical protein